MPTGDIATRCLPDFHTFRTTVAQRPETGMQQRPELVLSLLTDIEHGVIGTPPNVVNIRCRELPARGAQQRGVPR